MNGRMHNETKKNVRGKWGGISPSYDLIYYLCSLEQNCYFPLRSSRFNRTEASNRAPPWKEARYRYNSSYFSGRIALDEGRCNALDYMPPSPPYSSSIDQINNHLTLALPPATDDPASFPLDSPPLLRFGDVGDVCDALLGCGDAFLGAAIHVGKWLSKG